jgi:hypothetical protein
MSDAPQEVEAEPEDDKGPPDRSKDLLGPKRSKLRKYLDTLYDDIHKGFQDQSSRSDSQMDFWDCFNCILNSNQFYNGNAEIYVPIIRDAVVARATRFVNQLFPSSGRYVEAVSSDGHQPADIIALLDHYIRRAKLKTSVARPLSLCGDIEGQYNLYVDWGEIQRSIVSKVQRPPTIAQDGAQVPIPEAEEIDDIEEEDILDGGPVFEVLHDSDVLVLPATADSVDEALEAGGVVVIHRRMSKAKIDGLSDAGEFDAKEAKELKDKMKSAEGKDPEKKLNEAVGINAKGSSASVWEVWHKVPLDDKGKYDEDGARKLCRIWFGPDRTPLGCKRNPHWNDRCPLLSAPVVKIPGVFKGQSMIEPIASLQYEANDAANEMADADHYAALPIVAASPERAPGPLILNLAAVWDIDPASVKFMEFPDLGARGIRRIQAAMQAVFQALGVNPAMLPQQTGRHGAKRNQAEIAMEQQVDLLTTAEAVSVMEEGIFTPAMGWCVDLDHQFRDRELTVRMFGTMGIEAMLQQIPPLHNRARFEFKWWGVEQARNAAQLQQQIAWLNIARGMRQEIAQEGYSLRVGPVLEASAMSTFGARTGALVLVDRKHQMTMPAELENQLLLEGHEVPVQPMDSDIEHIKAHMPAAQADTYGQVKLHIQKHLHQLKMKQAAMMMAQGQAGGDGAPSGQRPSRGGAPPRMGAQPAGPRMSKGPPGMIRPDSMPKAGAVGMPRKM